jgi:TPR repeat protein
MSYRLVTPPRSWNLPLSVLACAALLASLSPVTAPACGWWGDGEMNQDDDAIIIGADGRPVTRQPVDNQGPVYEAITLRANALRKGGGASPAEIARLYLAAAGGGFPPAQNSLGNLYEQGLGVEQSNPRAAYWYRRAAEQEEPRAQHSLGVMYLQGRGVPKDPAEGVSWLRRSAGQGHAAACADLANLYWTGEGVPQNKTRALAWWLIAAGSGDGKSVGLSSEAKRQMREAEIAAAEEIARNWAGNAR